jgi:exonuclease III
MDVRHTPTGRGITAHYENIQIVNIYAPSGSEKRRDRDKFFNTEVPQLLSHTQQHILLAGDFNCVLDKADCTGTPNYSHSLANLIQGLKFQYAWTTNREQKTYTHYTAQSATRIDRIYMAPK